MSEIEDVDAARKAYESKRPLYESLANEVHDILKKKFSETGLNPVSVTHRAKQIESFIEKITRKNYNDLFIQMTDLAGVRIVCAYEAELTEVAKIIDESFEVRERVDKAQDLGVDRMGYNGKAYVVALGTRYAGGRYERITTLNCEIQVRTILQDAWATLHHQLVYKKEDLTPARLRRDLNNVSSLLEIAQGIFDSVKEKRATYVNEIQNKEENRLAFLAQPLDFDTVIAYTRWKFPNNDASERLTQLMLRDIKLERYPTLEHLDVVVDRARAAVQAYRKEKPEWFKTGTDYLTKSLGFVDPDFRRTHGFAGRTRTAFDTYKHLILTAHNK